MPNITYTLRHLARQVAIWRKASAFREASFRDSVSLYSRYTCVSILVILTNMVVMGSSSTKAHRIMSNANENVKFCNVSA